MKATVECARLLYILFLSVYIGFNTLFSKKNLFIVLISIYRGGRGRGQIKKHDLSAFSNKKHCHQV